MFNLWNLLEFFLLAILNFSVQTHVNFNISSVTLNRDLNQKVSILPKKKVMVSDPMSDRPIHKPIFGHFEITEFN